MLPKIFNLKRKYDILSLYDTKNSKHHARSLNNKGWNKTRGHLFLRCDKKNVNRYTFRTTPTQARKIMQHTANGFMEFCSTCNEKKPGQAPNFRYDQQRGKPVALQPFRQSPYQLEPCQQNRRNRGMSSQINLSMQLVPSFNTPLHVIYIIGIRENQWCVLTLLSRVFVGTNHCVTIRIQ